MAKKRRQARIPTPLWERPRGAIGSRILGRTFQFYGSVAIGLLLLVAVGIVGYAFWNDEAEKRGRPGSTAVQVEDTHFKLDYFSSRLKMYVDQFGGQGADPAQPANALPAVSSLLIREEIVRRFASEFEATASEDEIRAAIASRLGIDVDDETFEALFQQELTRSGLSEEDYRLMIEAEVLEGKLRESFLAELPASAESLRLRQILVSTDERAQELRKEIEDGGDFAALAAQNSLDPATKDNGGEVSWVPRGVLDPSTEELLFSTETGKTTTIPLPAGVYVIQVEEKAEDREIDEDQKQQLAARALADWVEEKKQSLTIVNNMDLSEGDPKKIQWAVDRAYQS